MASVERRVPFWELLAHPPAVFVRDCMRLWRTTEHENRVNWPEYANESKGLTPIFIAVANKGDKSRQHTSIVVRPIGGKEITM